MTLCLRFLLCGALFVFPQFSQAQTTHTVKAGETLWRISQMHGVSPAAIQELNQLSSDQVRVGQELKIPTTQSLPRPKTRPFEHRVARGETFSQIARRYGTSVAALQAANPDIQPERILEGSLLKLPGEKQPVPAAATTSQPPVSQAPSSAGKSATHTVAQGDTLGSIAKRYGISLQAIQQANDLADPNKIRLGQKLILPGAPATTVAPVPPAVTPAVAEQPKQVVPAIQDSPQPARSAYQPPALGQVPDPIPDPIAKLPLHTIRPGSMPRDPTPVIRGVNAYRVLEGETLQSIAAGNQTTVERLRELNQIPVGKEVQAGQEIIVPRVQPVY